MVIGTAKADLVKENGDKHVACFFLFSTVFNLLNWALVLAAYMVRLCTLYGGHTALSG